MKTDKGIEIERIVKGIYGIETYYLGREGFAGCYLLVAGGEAAIIETNTNWAVPAILGTLDKVGVAREQVKYVLLTHIHLDHAGGAGALMEHLPGAILGVHPRGRKHMINPEKLIESVKEVYGEAQYQTLYGEIKAIDKERVQTLEEGNTLYVGDRELQIYDMPGHARHHVVIFDPASGSLFSGDNFGIGYPRMRFNGGRLIFPSTSPTQFEPDQARLTYERIVKLKPARVLLTHYGALTSELGEIEATRDQLNRWLDYSVVMAGQGYAEGLRSQVLTVKLQEALWQRLEYELRVNRGLGLTADEKEWLLMDTDLNAQGLALYIEKINAPQS